MKDLFNAALSFGSPFKENNTGICGLHLKVGGFASWSAIAECVSEADKVLNFLPPS